MIRTSLNLYLDGFLSLAADKQSSRLILIEEALSASSMTELLREWIWIHDLDKTAAIKIKLWFQLSYLQLSRLFGISTREVSQLIRNQRVLLLPGYRPVNSPTVVSSDEISCFMVEQHLSPWVDGELRDLKTVELIHKHLNDCKECHSRLEQFRELQTLILQSRMHQPEISKEEWSRATTHLQAERRQQLYRIVSFTMVVLLISAFLAWAIFSKPEKMPNVYEIG